ncbi:MAG TPA: TetR/AcrR family transcriptional regulator [Actinophytocola sp.]|uniref:TetR/AcrR family transcriptional regulator n=1 Tax=Actinophytocola sp. TaxID=1872138 RepID=UPI002DDD22F0|nr:TetR/AcrR family transcriptional regulator [Actinophytocola sp.]HEV2781289.1 TetR/AcrR family transcriptional regulator [Actinophytocola sp.]
MTEPRKGDARRDRWRSHREARRAEFVDAALRVLATHGPDFGMEHVAAAAGITKPVLYRHFTDKEDLIVALGQRGTELLFDRLIPALNNVEAPIPRIRRSLVAYFSVIEEHPNLYRLLIRRPIGRDVVAEDKELIGAALSRVLGGYLRALDVDPATAEPWAHGIVGMVQNVSEWWLERRTMSRDAVVEHLTQNIWFAIDGIARQNGLVIDPNKPIEVTRIAN